MAVNMQLTCDVVWSGRSVLTFHRYLMIRSFTLMVEAAGTYATSFDRSGKLFRNVDTLTRLYEFTPKKTADYI
jgi:hypothetical protein